MNVGLAVGKIGEIFSSHPFDVGVDFIKADEISWAAVIGDGADPQSDDADAAWGLVGVGADEQADSALEAVVGGGETAFVGVQELEAVESGSVLEEAFVQKGVVPVVFPDGQNSEEVSCVVDSPLVLCGAAADEEGASQADSREDGNVGNFSAKSRDVLSVGQDNEDNGE